MPARAARNMPADSWFANPSQSKLASVPSKKSERLRSALASKSDDERSKPRPPPRPPRRRSADSPSVAPTRKRLCNRPAARRRRSRADKTVPSRRPRPVPRSPARPRTVRRARPRPRSLPRRVASVLGSNCNRARLRSPPRPSRRLPRRATRPRSDAHRELPPRSARDDLRPSAAQAEDGVNERRRAPRRKARLRPRRRRPRRRLSVLPPRPVLDSVVNGPPRVNRVSCSFFLLDFAVLTGADGVSDSYRRVFSRGGQLATFDSWCGWKVCAAGVAQRVWFEVVKDDGR